MNQLIEFLIVIISIFVLISVGVFLVLFKKHKISSKKILKAKQVESFNDITSIDEDVQQILGVLSSDNDYTNYDEVMDTIIKEYSDAYKTKGQIY